MTGRLLTAREVAKMLDVSAETVLRWTRRGQLPAIRLPGGAIRYRRDDLDGWLIEHGTGAAPRGVSAAQGGRARDGGYSPLLFSVSAVPPPDAAKTEEE